eukprot:g3720.t1
MFTKKQKEPQWSLSVADFKDTNGSPENMKRKICEGEVPGAPTSVIEQEDADGTRKAQVEEIMAAEEAIRQARELTQGSMRFNHFTSGGTRRDEIEVSTLRRISNAIARLFRIKRGPAEEKKQSDKVLDNGHDKHREEIDLIKFKNADFLDYLRTKVRDARSRSELRKVFVTNQIWLAMVELAPPEHSHTLLPDELSKMLFKGVEQESETLVNTVRVKRKDFLKHIRQLFDHKGPRQREALIHALREATTVTATSGDAYLVVYTLIGSSNLISKGLRLRLRNGKDNCRTGIEYSKEKDRIIIESINLFDLLLLRQLKNGKSQTVRLFSLRVCILQQIDVPTWSNVRMASVLLMTQQETAKPPPAPTKGKETNEGGSDKQNNEEENYSKERENHIPVQHSQKSQYSSLATVASDSDHDEKSYDSEPEDLLS